MNLSSFQTMTSAEINRRLDELSELRATHQKRDLDAEVADAVRAGADLDALEYIHLDAERLDRRHRVEIEALKTALVDAKQRDGANDLSRIEKHYRELRVDAETKRDELHSAWSAFVAAVDAWKTVQKAAERETFEAASIAKDTGAVMPRLGYFNSAKIAAIAGDWHRDQHTILPTIVTAERSVHTDYGLHATKID